jgi:hypothetical protein
MLLLHYHFKLLLGIRVKKFKLLLGIRVKKLLFAESIMTSYNKLFLVDIVITLFSLFYLMIVDNVVTLPFYGFIGI